MDRGGEGKHDRKKYLAAFFETPEMKNKNNKQ